MIVTVTPNPGLDLTYLLPADDPGADVDVHRAEASTLEASGKGVNVSRALTAVGVATTAVLPVGGSTGRSLVDLLDLEGVPHVAVAQARDTRVNTSAVRPGGATLKLNGPGGRLNVHEQQALLDAVADTLSQAVPGTGPVWLAVCGSLPPGVGPDLVARLIGLARDAGVRCAVDSSGEGLRTALEAGADLLAPNGEELAAVSDAVRGAASTAEVAAAARDVAAATGTELLVSLGRDGALHTDGSTVLRGWGPPLEPVNTAGAGDALLAGWLGAEGDPRARLARAVAWGRSACLSPTTVDAEPGRRDPGPVTVEEVSLPTTTTSPHAPHAHSLTNGDPQ